jgi:DNA-binding response OmpR family regulator
MSTLMHRFQLGELVVDLQIAQIEHADGAVTPLSMQEVVLLAYLLSHRDRFVPTRELLVDALGYAEGATSRAAGTAILRLRRKLEPEPERPRFLVNRYRLGYRIVGPQDL